MYILLISFAISDDNILLKAFFIDSKTSRYNDYTRISATAPTPQSTYFQQVIGKTC